jgi:hypothetical protein
VCQVELAALIQERADLANARTARAEARATRDAAVAAYRANPTARNLATRNAARVTLAAARGAVVVARNDRNATRGLLDACLLNPPGVTVSNPHVVYYGNYFGVADITWRNIPNGDYHFFIRYEDGTISGNRYPVTFVDVLPPSPSPEDETPRVSYRQNGVLYSEAGLDNGCVYAPGSTTTVELWTSVNAGSPAGLKVAVATVDNPCT